MSVVVQVVLLVLDVAVGSDETDRIYAVDVGGTRFTFRARIPKRTTAADRAELQVIVDSITFEAPSNPTPSEAPTSS